MDVLLAFALIVVGTLLGGLLGCLVLAVSLLLAAWVAGGTSRLLGAPE